MSILHVERIGGLANFGGAHSHIRSQGKLDTSTLSAAEMKAVESLFQNHSDSEAPEMADGFRFRIIRTTATGTESIVAPEAAVPSTLASCVKDEFV